MFRVKHGACTGARGLAGLKTMDVIAAARLRDCSWPLGGCWHENTFIWPPLPLSRDLPAVADIIQPSWDPVVNLSKEVDRLELAITSQTGRRSF